MKKCLIERTTQYQSVGN